MCREVLLCVSKSGVPSEAYYRMHVEKNWGGKLRMALAAKSQRELEDALGFQLEEVIR